MKIERGRERDDQAEFDGRKLDEKKDMFVDWKLQPVKTICA